MVSLWALVILSMISVAITAIVSPQIKLARVMEERFACQVAAEAALNYVYFEMIGRPQPKSEYDSLADLDTEKEIKLGKVTVTYKLTDEESKLDINTATKDMIMRLPELNNDQVAQNIIDYRQNPGKFAIKEQLLLVPGVAPEAYSQFKDLITVWSDGKININTVSGEALRVLGFNEGFVISLINFRKGEEGVFKNTGTINSDIEKIIPVLSEQDSVVLNQANFTTKSTRLILLAEARFPGQLPHKYQITFEIDKGKVLRWQED